MVAIKILCDRITNALYVSKTRILVDLAPIDIKMTEKKRGIAIRRSFCTALDVILSLARGSYFKLSPPPSSTLNIIKYVFYIYKTRVCTAYEKCKETERYDLRNDLLYCIVSYDCSTTVRQNIKKK